MSVWICCGKIELRHCLFNMNKILNEYKILKISTLVHFQNVPQTDTEWPCPLPESQVAISLFDMLFLCFWLCGSLTHNSGAQWSIFNSCPQATNIWLYSWSIQICLDWPHFQTVWDIRTFTFIPRCSSLHHSSIYF